MCCSDAVNDPAAAMASVDATEGCVSCCGSLRNLSAKLWCKITVPRVSVACMKRASKGDDSQQKDIHSRRVGR